MKTNGFYNLMTVLIVSTKIGTLESLQYLMPYLLNFLNNFLSFSFFSSELVLVIYYSAGKSYIYYTNYGVTNLEVANPIIANFWYPDKEI